MAEIFSTATAAAAALEQCIQLFSRFRQAARRQKGLPELVENYLAEVSQTKKIVELAASEAALKTPNVGASNDKGPFRGFVKQLVSGKGDHEKLDGIMRHLGNAKQDLGMYIQLANLGLTRAVGETVRVNTVAVEAVNKQLAENLGSVYSLKIGEMIEGRARDADGTVTLTEDDIFSLSGWEMSPAPKEADVPDRAEDQASRIIRGNEAAEYALQVNTPIGVDVWKDMGSVTVEKNKATGHASQWNYPVASIDAFLAALEMRRPTGPDGQDPVCSS